MSVASRVRPLALLSALSGALGCGSEAAKAPPPTPPPTLAPVGVLPRLFECTSVASDADLTRILGAAPRWMDMPAANATGLAKICSLALMGGDAGDQLWSFDFDCRDGFKQRADQLFAQYTDGNARAMAGYAADQDAGVAPPQDAPPPTAPTAAVNVPVGARGLDQGQALLFLDDDAPCYGRVFGPDPARRLALAEHLAKTLTPSTAPIPP